MQLFLICCYSLFLLSSSVSLSPAVTAAQAPSKSVNNAFTPGEVLTYNVSWSDIIQAGIAVMEVREGKTPEGKPGYLFLSTTHSVGVVETFFPVRDSVQSIVDAGGLYSTSFSLRESHGKKKRERDMVFDHDKKTVRVTINGQASSYPVPEHVQDALSSLYYLRAHGEFIVGRSQYIDVHDNDKTWSVEIQTLGKEHIKTPAGEFDTIKVKTYPKYEGVFMHKGEIYIWITDDSRRMPVLMKSIISIGSVMATLTKCQEGGKKP